MKNTLRELENISLFDHLNGLQLKVLLPYCRLDTFKAGDRIQDEGEQIEEFRYIYEGRVEFIKDGRLLHTSQRGVMLGLTHLNIHSTLSVVISKTDCKMLAISKEGLDFIEKNHSLISAFFYKSLSIELLKVLHASISQI